MAVEVFVVEPGDGTLCSGGVIIGHGSLSLLLSSVPVFVDPDLLFAGLPVVLDHADGAEKLGDVVFDEIGGQAGNVDLIV